MKQIQQYKFSFPLKNISALLHIKRIKENLKNISRDGEKSLTKLNMLTIFSKLGLKGNFLKRVIDNYENI